MKPLASLTLLSLALTACSSKDDGNTTTAAAPVAASSAPAGQAWTDTVVKTDEGYLMGNPAAAIKLVEFGARSCPTCGAFGREGFPPLTSKYVASGKVSFEFRDFLVHGAPDLALTLLGQCGGPAPFFPILEQMYSNQNAFLDKLQMMSPPAQQALQGKSPAEVVTALAQQMGAIDFVKQRGVPEAKARACLTSQPGIEAAAKTTETHMKDGSVTGTPTFLINGQPYTGAPTWEGVEAALKAAGA